MSCPFSAFVKFLSFDFAGRTWTRRAQHPFFGELTYFGSKKCSECYWEAELSRSGLAEPVRVTMTGTSEGPTPDEQRFCETALDDLDALFDRCRPAFAMEFERWAERALPQDWRAEFALFGFQVPVDGDPAKPWEIRYFVDAADRSFLARFRDGMVAEVVVEG